MNKIQKFNSIKELACMLQTNVRLIEMLYEERDRKNITLRKALTLAEKGEETISYLEKREIIEVDNGMVELHINFKDFLREQLEDGGEIKIGEIRDHIESIKENMEYYETEKNPDARITYIKRITENLERIRTKAIRNTKDIKELTEETYKNERDYEVKNRKLTKIEEKIDLLDETLNLMEKTMENHIDGFASITANKRLIKKTEETKADLEDVRKNLINEKCEIIKYLCKFETYNRNNKIIHKIWDLKDQHRLSREKVEEILKRHDEMFLQNRSYVETNPSINELTETRRTI